MTTYLILKTTSEGVTGSRSEYLDEEFGTLQEAEERAAKLFKQSAGYEYFRPVVTVKREA